MKFGAPTSRSRLLHKVQAFDIAVAAICPPLSLILRDPTIFFGDRWASLALYCAIGFAATVLIFQIFGVGRGLHRFASTEDATDVWKAAVGSAALSSAIFFTLTRLDDIPRSAPLIQLVLLGTGLSLGRAFSFLNEAQPTHGADPANGGPHCIVYGANKLAWFYLRMIETLSAGRDRAVGIVDDDPRHKGQSFCGRPILGSLSELGAIIAEYKTHGVQIDHLVVAFPLDTAATREASDRALAMCERIGLRCTLLSRLLTPQMEPGEASDLQIQPSPLDTRDFFWRLKRVIDCCVAGVMGLLVLPLIALAAIVLALDVGLPVIFWQYRVGQHGRRFKIYKFRTMRASVDGNGDVVPEVRRLSRIGAFMRRTRIDELPQLWNILRGDMTFIGPRPLLPEDQPKISGHRLAAPPGITGWAQVHGGKLIGPEEKAALDEWYVEHASFWLDMRIAILTFVIVCFGDRRNEQVLSEAIGNARARALALPDHG